MAENSHDPLVIESEMIDRKPPPIVVQMESIAPEPIAFGGVDLKHDWFKLLNSAPFQMYACEMTSNSYSNVEEWIVPYIEDRIINEGEDRVFNSYCTWHEKKGYWNNETVYGDLKGDEEA